LLLTLAFGMLGALLSVFFLIVIPTDGAPAGYGQLIAEQLPTLVFVAAAGFGMGALIAVVWSIAQRLFAPSVPRA
jgi:ABC-type sugar transport system permease subunit